MRVLTQCENKNKIPPETYPEKWVKKIKFWNFLIKTKIFSSCEVEEQALIYANSNLLLSKNDLQINKDQQQIQLNLEREAIKNAQETTSSALRLRFYTDAKVYALNASDMGYLIEQDELKVQLNGGRVSIAMAKLEACRSIVWKKNLHCICILKIVKKKSKICLK